MIDRKFIRIGEMIFNVDQITNINRDVDGGKVFIYLAAGEDAGIGISQTFYIFDGAQAEDVWQYFSSAKMCNTIIQ